VQTGFSDDFVEVFRLKEVGEGIGIGIGSDEFID
jgi:hypothetical protein